MVRLRQDLPSDADYICLFVEAGKVKRFMVMLKLGNLLFAPSHVLQLFSSLPKCRPNSSTYAFARNICTFLICNLKVSCHKSSFLFAWIITSIYCRPCSYSVYHSKITRADRVGTIRSPANLSRDAKIIYYCSSLILCQNQLALQF